MLPVIRSLLASVSKPYRIAGGEVGSLVKDWNAVEVRFCLAFPDTYEIGMSNLGLAILYDVINSREGWLAERVFAPWGDVEAELKKRNMPLFSLESQRPLGDFDVVGVTLPYELTYTNILNILDLAGIPLRSKDRDEHYPLIIAGGPSAFNSEPVAAFFDAVVLGDGEEVIVRIAEEVRRYKCERCPKGELLKQLSGIDGVYIPQFYNQKHIRKAIVPDLDAAPFPSKPVVAHAAVQDRAGIEVQRGCVRGCRFCQAGMVYRPVRQRSPNRVSELCSSQLSGGGHIDLSLLSLSIGDYACLERVLSDIRNEERRAQLNVSLPSLRTESLTQSVLDRLGGGRSGSFTLAPEAATERMRAFINKGNTDRDLFASAEKVFQNGWSKIKLYFMVGLPGETEEEIDGIVAVANRCLDIGRRYHKRPEVTVSTSTFVSKAHTPFQWSAQITTDESLKIQRYLKKRLRRPGLYYRWHKAEMSLLEGVLSRGGRELADVIECAYQRGARFDGWDETFDMNRWSEAFETCGIDTSSYLKSRDRKDAFPWDHLYADLKKDFLWREYERAQRGEFTPSCSDGSCQQCGVCDFGEIKNRIYPEDVKQQAAAGISAPVHKASAAGAACGRLARNTRGDIKSKMTSRLRIRFSKTGRAAFLGHMELMDAIRRTMCRAELPVLYTEGFHPRPKIALSRPLSLGIESLCEFADVTLHSDFVFDTVLDRLNEVAPEGIRFTAADAIDDRLPSLDHGIIASRFLVDLGQGIDPNGAIERFNASEAFSVRIMRRGKGRSADLRDVVTELAMEDGSVVGLWISHRGASVKPTEAIGAIFGLNEDEINKLNIKKVDVKFDGQ